MAFLGSVLVPPAISALFMTRRFLFLGYSLRDWNFRVMLSQRLQDAGKLKKSWAIQYKPNLIETKLWEREFEIFDMDLLDFSNELTAQVETLPSPVEATGVVMDVASAQLQVDTDCPYVGLCYFDEEHARFFFGRESDAELIAANVLSCGVMILHGPSGVGKSSVLSAALPAALQKMCRGR